VAHFWPQVSPIQALTMPSCGTSHHSLTHLLPSFLSPIFNPHSSNPTLNNGSNKLAKKVRPSDILLLLPCLWSPQNSKFPFPSLQPCHFGCSKCTSFSSFHRPHLSQEIHPTRKVTPTVSTNPSHFGWLEPSPKWEVPASAHVNSFHWTVFCASSKHLLQDCEDMLRGASSVVPPPVCPSRKRLIDALWHACWEQKAQNMLDFTDNLNLHLPLPECMGDIHPTISAILSNFEKREVEHVRRAQVRSLWNFWKSWKRMPQWNCWQP
jgi:hypothetical protein